MRCRTPPPGVTFERFDGEITPDIYGHPREGCNRVTEQKEIKRGELLPFYVRGGELKGPPETLVPLRTQLVVVVGMSRGEKTLWDCDLMGWNWDPES
ncbi:hypothetical protein AVEN_3695-1 [Araneus ventricosus]|uniref:Uncharacterized protein n=1 Tax=Araneus ventricosus TaxID=182803 RepID=A0A4Y2N0Y2_ARAVE|nr:hypothetical protein AVEN_3695-1 [Araneus ventricosus]